MAKWADYCIVAVHHGDDPAVIEEVKARADNGDTISTTDQKMSRIKVISLIESGTTFVTALLRDGKWKQGASVSVVRPDGGKYLRTDANKIKADNLGELPEY